jgi:hypothetical protein
MIYADLNGKSHVPEDVLTSNCLGLLNLLPKCDFLSFLALARNSSGAPLRIAMSSTADLSLDFWPYLRDGGIPDAVVTVEMSGAERFKVFIEAKHGASQSGN